MQINGGAGHASYGNNKRSRERAMSTGIEAFDHSLQLTNLWFKDLMRRLGTEDRHLAYLALRTTLHALRDRLAVDEAAHLGAQLPMLVRGLYYEGWRPAGKPAKERSREAFLAHVRAEAHALDFDPEAAARAVFGLLAERITAGEIEDVKGMLPQPIRELWPA
jgi:uncharacterized protein (DUF2267 family)